MNLKNTVVIWAVAVVVLAALAIANGATPVTVAAVIVGGAVVGYGLPFAPARPRVILAILVGVGGAIVAASLTRDVWMFFGWVGSLILGASAADIVQNRRPRAAVTESAEEAVVRVISAPDGHEVVEDDPQWHAVEGALRALDGDRNWYLTIARRTSRLDVCILGAGRFAVFVRSIPEHGPEDIYQLLRADAGTPDPRQTTRVRVPGRDADYPSALVVPSEEMLVAARTFLESGERDRSLSWDRGSKYHEVVIIPGLPE